MLTSAVGPVCRDEEMDGEWEAPQVANPTCVAAPGCGEWKRPVINNPQYKGKWKAPLVDNPNYQVPGQVLFKVFISQPFFTITLLPVPSEGRVEAAEDQEPRLLRGPPAFPNGAFQGSRSGVVVHDL